MKPQKKTEDTTLHLLVIVYKYIYISERRALNSKCWHWLLWINKFRWQNGWKDEILWRFTPWFSSSRISEAPLSEAAKPTAASNPPPLRTPNEPNLEPATWLIRLLHEWSFQTSQKKCGNSLFVSGKKQIKLDQKFIKCFKIKHYPIQLIQSIHPELRMGFLQGQLWLQKKTSWWLDSQQQKPYSLLPRDSK